MEIVVPIVNFGDGDGREVTVEAESKLEAVKQVELSEGEAIDSDFMQLG